MMPLCMTMKLMAKNLIQNMIVAHQQESYICVNLKSITLFCKSVTVKMRALNSLLKSTNPLWKMKRRVH